MKILLINENATVEKLVRLSAQRIGLELLAATIATDAIAGEYTWVLVDNDSLGGASVESLREKYPNAKLGLLYPKNGQRAEGYDLYIEKPFLPTELIDEFSARGDGASKSEAELPAELPSIDDALFGDPISNSSEAKSDKTGGFSAAESALEADLSQSSNLNAAQAEQTAPQSDFDDTFNSDSLEDLSEFDAPAPLDEIAPDAPDQSDIGESKPQTPPQDSLNVAEATEFDLPDLGDIEASTQTANVETPENAASEAKTAILDKEEIEEVKELLNEIGEPTAEEPAPQAETFLLDEEFSQAQNSDENARESAIDDDLKLDLGENSALLDDEDLADLHQNNEDSKIEDETALSKKDSLSEIEELSADLDESEAIAPKKPKLSFGEITPRQTESKPADDEFKISFDEAPSAPIAPLNDEDDEFLALDEPEVARALGEAPPIDETLNADLDALDLSTDDLNADGDFNADDLAATVSFGDDSQGQSAIGGAPSPSAASKKALENLLAALPPNSLRELLDGMQLTINISFPKKK
ncbi:MAG: hypothetical protein LBO72_04760 [Helicobacteraceae bacterium]|jgi:uncharacterized membrane protein|nr:hypothetical protein [Helicobacteraceae bacterium]